MASIFETKATTRVNVHYVRGRVPSAGNREGYYIENSDVSLGELLQDQEIVHQSLQSGHRRQLEVGNSSQTQLERDAAFARSLQEVEYQLNNNSLSETPAANRGTITPEPSPVRQDNVVPDYVNYESLSMKGTHLAQRVEDCRKSLFPTCDLSNTNQVAPQEKTDLMIVLRCVVCLMEYKNRDKLITLPCQHGYHSKCIKKWLKINKPIGEQAPQNLLPWAQRVEDCRKSLFPTCHISNTIQVTTQEKTDLMVVLRCVVCLMEYKNQEMLINLPCQHGYHSECITKWLKINKFPRKSAMAFWSYLKQTITEFVFLSISTLDDWVCLSDSDMDGHHHGQIHHGHIRGPKDRSVLFAVHGPEKRNEEHVLQ
ncbi:hypothetical protein HHK36_001081 [Tetracentron sinense]|uniref:RING-type domain-containing protein n=1 Tax=Tetracentron sinense TaxID=13715 RepID=A0A834ZT31_TETSI|nr:hypothetical protein HHK36_001081 [Tetracentron sinense]